MKNYDPNDPNSEFKDIDNDVARQKQLKEETEKELLAEKETMANNPAVINTSKGPWNQGWLDKKAK